MERLTIAARPDFPAKLEAIGLSFHSWDDYWKEDACYRFTADEVDVLEEATEELHGLCLEAVEHVVSRGRLAELGIPEAYWDLIARSWRAREPSLYGRFDLAYDGVHPPRMLEYNADTPTSLLESAVAQWYWLEDRYPHADQFNSLHERLVARWGELGLAGPVYVASIADNEEDWVCTHYLVDTALQAGLDGRHIYLEDIGWDAGRQSFVDVAGAPIPALFKLYPWEWLMRESFGPHIPLAGTRFIEPPWKAVLACKGILPILWELFPNHPNLLPAYFSPDRLASYAKKPLYSREGANVELYRDRHCFHTDPAGPYGAEGYVYQALADMPVFDCKYPVVGAWVVGDEAAGICLREDTTPVTTNLSNFVPHYFE